MIRIAVLTKEQRDSLLGREFIEGNLFAPVYFEGIGWCISEVEVTDNQNVGVDWVNSLTLIEYTPVWERP